MKSWTEDIIIHTPIEHVFSYFDGSLDQIQKLMPQLIANIPLKETDAIVGNIYRQQYREGAEIQEYDVETLDYINTHTYKKLKCVFTLANMFDITATYELTQTDKNQTLFKYTPTNKALNEQAKLYMKSATNQVVIDFVNRVKTIAESEYNQ
ncbi:hypothetical protein [Bacillus gaemokensis]|uniref:DUF3284 domain-containing protein n=1 Tax=Bacillus gaemokensis TaxID=574375 RepID=A0A073K7A5_9BACI|nr:hypothetical protein [Bacillus gaemokensis]KEK22357.1 hypothetical protein BAGA_19870 [Bacillus gaemokensis]KYG28853.1 hypothetical protein AZF08_14115 [Bacillus gaemokensis]